jgi:hypothetical protein
MQSPIRPTLPTPTRPAPPATLTSGSQRDLVALSLLLCDGSRSRRD